MKESMANDVLFMAPGGGPTLTFMGAKIAYKVTCAETNGTWALLEFNLPSRFKGIDLHWHSNTHTGFYVLEGRVTFRLGTHTFVGGAGAFISVPPHILHAFSNEQDQPACMLEIMLPGGIENYFKERVALAQTGQAVLREDSQALRELGKRYDLFMQDES